MKKRISLLLKKQRTWWKNFTKKEKILLFSILAVGCLLILLEVIFLMQRENAILRFQNHTFYQYFSGQKFEYRGTIKFDKNGGVTKLESADVTVHLDSSPVYFQDEKQVLFPEDMAIVFPNAGKLQYKLNYYTKIYQDEFTFYAKEARQTKQIEHCFLYDGNDLYFFLEETTLTYGQTALTLHPFSFVIVHYNQSIEIYDPEANRMIVEPLTNESVKATTATYTIDLGIDALLYGDQKSRLLLKNIDFLPHYF